MKKITYNVNFILVGQEPNIKDVIIDFIKKQAIEASYINDVLKKIDYYEFLIVYEKIPIRLRIFSASNLDEIIYNHDKIKVLDVIVLITDLNKNTIEKYESEKVRELNEYFSFKGISALLDFSFLNVSNNYNEIKKNKEKLIEKAKELDSIYCFTIYNIEDDLKEFFSTIFNDLLFKFRISSLELFEDAIKYGSSLISK
ncbi:MAG: hypothetical protein ACTSVV_16050 [Promethearchaeota archaeon]